MGRISDYLKKYLLGLAGLALIAHLIIPHDHHTSDSFLRQDSDCPVHEQDHGNQHKGLPVHCHAFNDLASEKAVKQISVFKVKIDISDAEIRNDLVPDQAKLPSVSSFHKPPPEDLFPDCLLHLRAPPSVG